MPEPDTVAMNRAVIVVLPVAHEAIRPLEPTEPNITTPEIHDQLPSAPPPPEDPPSKLLLVSLQLDPES